MSSVKFSIEQIWYAAYRYKSNDQKNRNALSLINSLRFPDWTYWAAVRKGDETPYQYHRYLTTPNWELLDLPSEYIGKLILANRILSAYFDWATFLFKWNETENSLTGEYRKYKPWTSFFIKKYLVDPKPSDLDKIINFWYWMLQKPKHFNQKFVDIISKPEYIKIMEQYYNPSNDTCNLTIFSRWRFSLNIAENDRASFIRHQNEKDIKAYWEAFIKTYLTILTYQYQIGNILMYPDWTWSLSTELKTQRQWSVSWKLSDAAISRVLE